MCLKLLRWLATEGFVNATAVGLPGEFSPRGGIVDVFAPDWNAPVRIELFGDQIESLRRFEVASQRSLQSLDSIEITVLKPDPQQRAHLTAYIPPASWFLLIEPQEIDEEARHYIQRLERPQDVHEPAEVLQQIYRYPSVTVAAVSTGSLEATCHLRIESVERFSGDVGKVRDDLDAAAAGQEVFLICQTEAEIERLGEVFNSTRLAEQGRLHFALGRLETGFRLVPQRIVLVSGNELFQRGEISRPSQRRLGRVIDSFLELREGDYVVHLAHGIGRYRGLKLLEKADQVEEHLELEFFGGTKIYVPAANIELVQKYVGGSKSKPTLAHIGGRRGSGRRKRRVEAVLDLADRNAASAGGSGIAARHSVSGRHRLAARVRRRVPVHGNARPAHRHYCGERGHAGRPADGSADLRRRGLRQNRGGDAGRVQGGRSRLSGRGAGTHYDPLRAASPHVYRPDGGVPVSNRGSQPILHRQGASAIIKGLKGGSLDIAIGTHRLAQHDVTFANLGLLVIDEEQRFGVDVKERLKALRQTIDVLTMTATPIPPAHRPHVAGGPARHLPIWRTPPEDRLAVETRVTRFDEAALILPRRPPRVEPRRANLFRPQPRERYT